MRRLYGPGREDSVPVEVTRTGEPSPQEYEVPPIDLYETDNGWVLVADVPGVTKENVALEVDKGVLTLHARVEDQAPAGRAIHEEFERTDFYRSFPLSDQVDRERITANVSGGVLTVVLPKGEQARPRRIAVESGD